MGERFITNMYFDRFGGDYLMDNRVVEFETGSRIAWAPAAGDERAGNVTSPIGVPVGHRWIFELTPDGDARLVTESYDRSKAPRVFVKWSTAARPGAVTWRRHSPSSRRAAPHGRPGRPGLLHR